ncbi:MAG TPA: SMC-Scp complex subunit ScpB [Armatimonadota bacterium]|nr:SMC-Scp complex subunit ScpB [Armatimonadota bacterium]HOP79590.1 SMC-Scp complex subunit ScpB [Armatimonadota bacterium]HPP75620.1 SMC-Scp complex subunit ScpB [Armatimonadota bacterium]
MESCFNNSKLKSAIECMLFVSQEPISAAQMAAALETDEPAIEQAVYDLILDLGQRGLQIVRVAGGYQMCTRPEYSDACQRILVPQNQKLSRAAFETLAVVAYRQPVTQPEVESIRGVDSSGVMKKLLERGLIKEVGRKQTPGRPILYGTTSKFLEHLGLNDLSELPDIDSLAVDKIRELEAQQELFTNGEIVAAITESEPEMADAC